MVVAGQACDAPTDDSGHFVRFYQADATLIDEVVAFADRALHAGGRAVVIATQPHLSAIGQRLSRGSHAGLESAPYPGRYLALDAEQTLARFMVDDWPDEGRFFASVGTLMASAAAPGRGPVHAFGEMVGVLCERGQHEAALRLEALWNELARRYAFTLFCAYPHALFSSAEHSPVFEHICAAHTHVLPNELLASADDAQQHRLVALWQQKAMALEREVERRTRAEATLRATQRQRDALFMNAPVAAALLCGPDHVFELVNTRFCELAGGEALTGRAYADVFPAARHGNEIGALLTQAFERDERVVREDVRIDMTRPDGAFEPRYFTFHFEPMRLDEQTVDGVIVVAVDVTEQVRARSRFEKSHAERERLVAELREAGRAKDEFLAMLGHELRNPLSPIVTALRLMRMRTEGATLREQNIIARQVDHLVRLVDDLLDISRITRGKIELKKQTVRVAEVLSSAVEMANFLLDQRRHRITVDVDRALVWHVDATRLAQVVSNLLTNAARYTAAGGHIELTAAREPSGMIVVSVRDNGIGLAPEVLPRVFELFFQGKRNLDRAEGGLGIGLALVKKLVEMHGGRVSAISEGVGRGSTFVIRVPSDRQARGAVKRSTTAGPASRSAAAAAASCEDAGCEDSEGSERAGLTPAPVCAMVAQAAGAATLAPAVYATPRAIPRRVLLVDDNLDGLQALAELLKECGHEVEAVCDPAAALEIVPRFLPEIAVIDIGLPVMDGYELVHRLRAERAERNCLFVALTGYGQDADRHRSREAGFHRHLVKPVDPSQLLRLIDALPRPASPVAEPGELEAED
jgi:signal transduction histidine kinase/ActR/RegA family two-component response regulator